MPQIVYETLPCCFIDLDHCTVLTLDTMVEDQELFDGATGEEQILDSVIESGRIEVVDMDTGKVTPIHWGKTSPSTEDGFVDVIVDLPEININHLRALWLYGVIDGDCPDTPPNRS